MIKTAALVAAATVALAASAAAAPMPCATGSHSVQVDFAQGPATFGCKGYQPSSSIVFNLGQGGFYIQADMVDVEGPDKINLMCNDRVLSVVSRYTNVQVVPASCDLSVRFTSDGSVQQQGFTLTAARANDVSSIRDSLETDTIRESRPGFHYYAINGTVENLSDLTVTLNVLSSSGIRQPSLFVLNNRLPTLDNPGTRAESSSGRAVANVNTGLAPNTWYLGVFLYGGDASYTLESVATVDTREVPVLTNGQIVNVTAVPGRTNYFQTERLNYNSPKLTVEMSRQVPGGYPKLLVCQGLICDSPDSPYYYSEIDTADSSYGTVSVSYPARSSFAKSGKYYLAVQSTHGDRGAGVVRVSW